MNKPIRLSAALAVLLFCAPFLVAEEAEQAGLAGFFARLKEKREALLEVTDSYRVNAEGFGYTAIQDTRMTPMVYRAPGVSALMEYRTYRPGELFLSTFFFQFSYPLTEENITGEYSYINPRGTIDFTYLRSLTKLPLYLGGSLNGTYNMRTLDLLGNSATNFDVVASINAVARWEDSFTLLKRPATWHIQAAVPLFSFVVRHPLYNVSYSGSEMIWAAPWQFYGIRLNAGFTRLLPRSSENRLTLDYFYDFYGLEGKTMPHDLNIGLHSITLGYALKLK